MPIRQTSRLHPLILLCLALLILFLPLPATAITAQTVALVVPVNTSGDECPPESTASLVDQLVHHFRYPYYEILPPDATAQSWAILRPAAAPGAHKQKLPAIGPDVLKQLAESLHAALVIVPEFTRLQHAIHQAPFGDADPWEDTYVALRCHVYSVSSGYQLYKGIAYGTEDVSLRSNVQYRIQEAWAQILPHLPPTIPATTP
ncbi:MAG TPA: hypothetical protein VN611_04485 [Patescibacteria group bacterium]|nr:hypothetical protein [Patescibacteria group bacterium]